MRILIINGPNLNLLGTREPDIYGKSAFEDYLETLRAAYPDTEIGYFQSNSEGALIDKMQQEGFSCDGIALNAGAYTHTSIALQDCIRSLKSPVVEVHISNVHRREEFRRQSMIAPACLGVICGFGLDSYRLAVEALKGAAPPPPMWRVEAAVKHQESIACRLFTPISAVDTHQIKV